MENKDKKQLDKLKEQFSKGANKGGGKKPGGGPNKRFNFYWVYAAIFIAFIGIQIFSSFNKTSKITNFSDFTTMLENQDVAKVKIVNEKEVQVYIKKEAVQNKDRYKEFRDGGLDGLASRTSIHL